MVINLERIFAWVFIIMLAFLIPNAHIIKFVDELCYMTLACLCLVDCVLNNRWRQYGLFWVIIGVMAFYVVYSMTQVHFNTKGAILRDFIIEMKPYMAFACMLAIAPKFTLSEKKILRWIALINTAICFLITFGGASLVQIVAFHPVYQGTTIFLNSMIFLYVSLDEKGQISRDTLYIVTAMVLSGIVCTRSKYYGECVLTLFFFYIYKPGIIRHLNMKYAIVIVSLIVIIIAVAYQKIDYYFLSPSEGSVSFDPDELSGFARPVLYATGILIMADHFPFGSGLASFASFPSTKPYSGVYGEYGIDQVFGLSEAMPDFICDAYYPLLAQFGVVGVVLFVLFWVYCCKYLRYIIRLDPKRFKYPFIIGSLMICFVLIESIGGTAFAQGAGVTAMMLLGIICGHSLKLMKKETEIINSEKQKEKLYI